MSDYTPTTEELALPPLNTEVIKELALLGLDQMVADVDDEKAEQFLAHVDRWLTEVKAQAWEQGATTIVATMVMNGSRDLPANPYRQGEEQ